MSTNTPSPLRANVYRGRLSGFWFVAIADPRTPTRSLRLRTYCSWAEAMSWAYKHLADLDATLMAEVHESRASRRARGVAA
ncbi:MAG: hypothetical protein ACTJGT_08535 [Microbacteriaceae bacterium]